MRHSISTTVALVATALAASAAAMPPAPCKGYGPYQGYGPAYGPGPMARPYGPHRPMWGPYPGRMAPAAPRHGAAMTTKPAPAGTAAMTTTGPQVAEPPGQAAASESAAVTIRQMQFTPPRVVVKRGATVTWTQSDGMPHTVTGSDGSFGSPRMNSGSEFSQTFDQAGTYGYYCSLHPSMRGEVVVID